MSTLLGAAVAQEKKKKEEELRKKEAEGGTVYDPETGKVTYKATGREVEDKEGSGGGDEFYGRGTGTFGR